MYFKIRGNLLSIFLAAFSIGALVGCGGSDAKSDTIPDSSDVSPTFYSVVTFGDSLSDSGSIKYLTEQFAGDTSPLLKRSVPISPKDEYSGYYSGRFSNGENWMDMFLTTLNLKVEDAQTCYLRGSNASCNYAVGSATTDENLVSDEDPMEPLKDLFKDSIVGDILNRFKIPQHVGIQQMITTYLDVSQPSPDVMSHTLYVIWGGGNDYFSGEDPSTTVSNLISSIKEMLDYQPSQEMRYFLIPNLPDIGKTPYGVAHSDLNLTEKVKEHNRLLREQLNSEIISNPAYTGRVFIIQVDAYKAFNEIYNNPARYGFTNVSDACYVGGYMPGEENTDCGEGQSYIFWDNIHPTTRAHCLFTQMTLYALKDADLVAKPDVVDNFKCD